MKENYKFPLELRELIKAALPGDTSLYGAAPELRHTYLPAGHAKALRPDNMLVVGIRGAGKSFWWAALQQKEHRALIGKHVGLSDRTHISTGFGEISAPDNYPGKDALASLSANFAARKIWQTVVLWQLDKAKLSEEFSEQTRWKGRVEWVQNHPEAVERYLFELDNQLEQQDIHHLVLFDALDRTADNWPEMNTLVQGLLQVLLDFRSFRRIRLKVFVRPDQIEEPSVWSFPDSSKIATQRTELNWPRNELYGIFWQYLANEPSKGHLFRNGCKYFTLTEWAGSNEIWPVPVDLRTNEELQRTVFHAIASPWMGRDPRRGFPFTWLPNHLADSHRQVSPRSFLAALRYAAEERQRPDQKYALHYESIKRGVQEASRIRVREIQEDYPWLQKFIKPLSGLLVPCPFEEIKQIWLSHKVMEAFEKSIAAAAIRLPPANLALGSEGVLTDLVNLGLVEKISNGRVNFPDVYRVGYALRRRGGVKPIGR